MYIFASQGFPKSADEKTRSRAKLGWRGWWQGRYGLDLDLYMFIFEPRISV